MLSRFALSAATLCTTTFPALAHPGHESDAGSLVAGLAHPLLGVDHVLAMVAVGLWAAFLGARAVWMVPAAFLLGMAGGFALAMAGIGLPMAEPGIAASVLVLGVLIAAAVRLPLTPSMLLVSLFAVLHGHSHGVELSGDALAFSLGFIAATILLHGAGIGLGRVLAGQCLIVARGLGGVVAGIGLLLLGGLA
jgi:urease accessory protein